jgi:cob(I)alamin adenosyltransferase
LSKGADVMLKKGLVHVYTGSSKGKTTAAMGLAFRALGQGLKVLVVQFLKGENESGEIKMLSEIPGAEIIRFPDQRHPLFCKEGCDIGELKKSITGGFALAREKVLSGEYDVAVLDEVNNCVKDGWLDVEEVVSLIREKPENVELVLTGRGCPERIIELADYATEMTVIKHPARGGVKARKGIEF